MLLRAIPLRHTGNAGHTAAARGSATTMPKSQILRRHDCLYNTWYNIAVVYSVVAHYARMFYAGDFEHHKRPEISLLELSELFGTLPVILATFAPVLLSFFPTMLMTFRLFFANWYPTNRYLVVRRQPRTTIRLATETRQQFGWRSDAFIRNRRVNYYITERIAQLP